MGARRARPIDLPESCIRGSTMAPRKPLIIEVGEALYGPRWQSDLARDLKVADRTMRRWVAGDVQPPPSVWGELLAIADERHRALGALLSKLREAAAKAD